VFPRTSRFLAAAVALVMAGCGAGNVVEVGTDGPNPPEVEVVSANLDPQFPTTPEPEGPTTVAALHETALGPDWSVVLVGLSRFTSAELQAQIPDSEVFTDDERLVVAIVRFRYLGAKAAGDTTTIVRRFVESNLKFLGSEFDCNAQNPESIPAGSSGIIRVCGIVPVSKATTASLAVVTPNSSPVLFTLADPVDGSLLKPLPKGTPGNAGLLQATVQAVKTTSNNLTSVSVSISNTGTDNGVVPRLGVIAPGDSTLDLRPCDGTDLPTVAAGATVQLELCAAVSAGTQLTMWLQDPGADDIVFLATA
jgi:hypothetical protein